MQFLKCAAKAVKLIDEMQNDIDALVVEQDEVIAAQIRTGSVYTRKTRRLWH